MQVGGPLHAPTALFLGK